MAGDSSGVRLVAPSECSGELYQSTTWPSSKRTHEGPYSQRSPCSLTGSPSMLRTSSRDRPRERVGMDATVPSGGPASPVLLAADDGDVLVGRPAMSQPSTASATAVTSKAAAGCRHN